MTRSHTRARTHTSTHKYRLHPTAKQVKQLLWPVNLPSMNNPTNRPAILSISHPRTNQLFNQWTSPPIANQSDNEPTNQPASQPLSSFRFVQVQSYVKTLLFVACLMSQQHVSVSQGRVCLTSSNMLVYLRERSA